MSNSNDTESPMAGVKKPRAQSGIAYPYYNLDISVELAKAIHDQGGGECSSAHLAAFLGYKSARSGTYLTRLSSAKLFGLVEGGTDALRPTERSLSIINPVMPDDRTREKVNAFLEVPLFTAIYERFKGAHLPPEMGLKNLLRNTHKVVEDRVNPATRVFYESADQAGFFDTTPDRTQLIPPLINKGSANSIYDNNPSKDDVTKPLPPPERVKSSVGDGTGGIHSALAGLLRELPPPGPWESKKKQQFLDAFTAIFDFIYPSDNTKGEASDDSAPDASPRR